MLVQGDYEGLEHLTNGNRLTAAEMADGVTEYGGSLVLPPDSAFDSIDIVEVAGATPREWDARMSLWTAEEGKSDLTLELTLRDSEEDQYHVQIDNIHVL